MRFALVVLLSAFAVVSCNRDPNVAKKRYVENGNKYFDKGRYKEARIMYRNALQKDMRYGEAHYRLALTALKLGEIPVAVGELRRAAELLPEGAERTDANVRLADTYLALTRDKRYLEEVDTIVKGILKKNPRSFDGNRLLGDLTFVHAQEAYRTGKRDESKEMLKSAIQEYRLADSIKPGESGLRLALARCLASDNQYAESEQIYREVIQRDKTLAPAYTELYQLYMMLNRPADAENTLKTAFNNNPKNFSYLTLLAAHYYGAKRHDDMVRVLTELKSHAKEYDQAYLTAGDFYLRVGDGEEAIRQYKEGMAADPKRKAGYQKRIIEVLMRQGKAAEAAEINNAILKENPKDTDSLGLQGSLLLDKGDVQKAIVELQGVVTAAPENFVARYNLGRAHIARNEYEQARQQFAEAIRLKPDYIPARVALAQLQVTRGEFDNAFKTAADILAVDSNSTTAKLIQSAALLGMKKYAASREILQSILAANPNSADTLFQLGVVNLSEGRYREAEDAFRKTHVLSPANSRGLMGIVETYLAQNQTDKAMALLQAEVQKSPNRMDYHLALGNTAVRVGRYDLAIAEFQKVLAGSDKNTKSRGDMLLRLGETYRRKGDLTNSINSLQQARQLLPENPVVAGTLAVTLDGAGRKQEAKAAYEQTLKLDPNNGIALNNLAFLIAENGGDLDQALTYCQRAKQILPQLAEVSDTLGWIYLKKNLNDSAVEIFRDLVNKQPAQPTYRYHFGMALSRKGDKVKALAELQTALKSNPRKEEADKIKELIAKLG